MAAQVGPPDDTSLAPLGEQDPTPPAPKSPNPAWFWTGWLFVVAAGVVIYLLPARDLTKCVRPTPAGGAAMSCVGFFQSGDGFASLAGFIFLAAALERIAQFTLAPWWGKVKVAPKDGKLAESPFPTHHKWAGVSDAAVAAQAKAKTAAAAQAKAATEGAATDDVKAATVAAADSVAADSVYVAATKQRPTIMLPMAAATAVVCSCLHLYLLHSLAKAGLPNSRLAFLGDGLLTGFVIAGGAQPFHDLVGNLTASASTTPTSATDAAPAAN